MRSRRTELLGLVLVSMLLFGIGESSAAPSLKMGSLQLHRCRFAAVVWCGQIAGHANGARLVARMPAS